MTPDTLLYLAAFVLVFPLLGFVINIFFGKKLGRTSSWLAVTIVGIDVLISVFILYTKLTTFADVNVIQTKITWLALGSSNIQVGILIDNLAAMMLIVVTLISFLVHLFSTEYMADDIRYSRYFAYLGLFTFSMLGIVIANNFLFMYIFWELVGVSSYLLIGFWYEKKSAADAGKKAFLVNRIGDLGFFAGILILFFTYNTVFFDEIFAGISGGHIPFNSGFWLTASGILIFCGAIGKSAQFPLHVWLPDAMEGPTPVSALIHAATMVAAGVYLVARVFPMFTADALTTIAYVGAFTAFMSATIAITQVDFKKVLAYSTVSQLGFMVMSLGACSYTTGFFHLVTHAWFKAALFLASGSVIHAMHHSMHKFHDHTTDPQDINNMGGLRRTMPLTYMTFLFATFALSGVPLTSGFLSKDGILAGTLAFAQLSGHWFIPIAGFAAAGMTAFYMFRLTIIAFHGEHKTEIAKNTHDNKFVIVFPLALLAVMSFWFFYSPNPINANQGWFVKNLPAPQTAVPEKYQFKFLTPLEKHENPYIMAMGQNCKGGECKDSKCKEGENCKDSCCSAGAMASVGVGMSGNSNTTVTMNNTKNEKSHGGEHAYFNIFEEKMHHAHLPAMLLSIIIAGCGILFSFMVYQFKIFSADNMAKQFSALHKFSFNKWYFDEIYHATIVAGLVGGSKVLAWFDLYLIDGMVNLTAFMTRGFSYFIGHFDNIVIDGFVNLSANVTGFFGAAFRKVQTGRVQTYLVFVVIGVMLLIYFFV